MLKNMLIIAVILLTTNVVLASSESEGLNFNVTQLDEVLAEKEEFGVYSTEWSPNGQYLLVTCSKSISPSNNIIKHYLLDINSHTFEEINYGIKEFNSYSIPKADWSPSGDRIYFQVSKFAGPTDSGSCFVVCNPDGTNLRGVGTNSTNLSSIIENLGNIGSQNNLKWSPDSSKIVFDWEKPGDVSSGVYIANGNGTNVSELRSEAKEPTWYDSSKLLFITTDEGTVVLTDDGCNLIQTFQPENRDEKYVRFLLSPDKEKIIFTSTTGNGLFQTYISNADGSNLQKYISDIDGSLLTESIAGTWQPNGSLLLVNQNESLYVIEGDENNKRLLCESNASEPQWFPNGKKILFVENENKLYSIDVDGTNLSFITNFGITSSYFWSLYKEAKQFSISPSGDIIAFTSALYPDTGKIIGNEPDPSTRQNIAAPLFVINSNGSNFTQVIPTTKGKYDIFGKWNPNKKQFTVESVQFFKSNDLSHVGSFLVELNAMNSSSTWRNIPVEEVIGTEEPNTINKVQSNASNFTDISQVNEREETSKQSPSFMLLQLFVCIMGVWLLQKKREI